MISFLVYAAAIGGLVLGSLGIIRGHDNRIRAEEADKWKPALAACKFNEDAAVTANEALRGDLKGLQGALAEQQRGVDSLKETGEAAQARAQAMLAAGKTKRETLQRELAVLRTRQDAVGSDKALSCEQNLSLVRSALNEAVEARLRWSLGLAAATPATAAPDRPASFGMRVQRKEKPK